MSDKKKPKLPLFDSGSPEASREIEAIFGKHAGEKLTPLNDAARRNLAKHACKVYVIRDGRTVCAYCGKELEL